jgi:NADH-quinone oxidoreductase subunit M
MYRNVFFGSLDEAKNGDLQDLNSREVYLMVPLIVLAFWIGIYSKPFTDLLTPASKATVAAVVNADAQRPAAAPMLAYSADRQR